MTPRSAEQPVILQVQTFADVCCRLMDWAHGLKLTKMRWSNTMELYPLAMQTSELGVLRSMISVEATLFGRKVASLLNHTPEHSNHCSIQPGIAAHAEGTIGMAWVGEPAPMPITNAPAISAFVKLLRPPSPPPPGPGLLPLPGGPPGGAAVLGGLAAGG